MKKLFVAAAAAAAFCGAPALAADLPTKAPAPTTPCAVDGLNSKISGFGGSFADKGLYGGAGSFALPLGCEFGVQIDGTAASLDSRFLGSIGGHLFWRNPAQALFGVYGSYTSWDQAGGVHAAHIGPEGEWYNGRWTLQGVTGVEFGNTTTGLVGPLTQTFDVKSRFFDQINLAYYLQDNFKVFAGHRFIGGKNALALGGEYGIPMRNGVMAALFAEGRVGEDNFRGVWGGIKFYFGQKDKPLIRRHREDDPLDWGSDFGGTTNTGNTSTTCPTMPPGLGLTLAINPCGPTL